MTPTATVPRPRFAGRLAALVGALLVWLAVIAAPATAATPSPAWSIVSAPSPTNFSTADTPGCLNDLTSTPFYSCDTYTVSVREAGGAPTDGSMVTITDSLPAGVTAQGVAFYWSGAGRLGHGLDGQTNLASFGLCTLGAQVQCEFPAFLGKVYPDDILRVEIFVTADPGASGSLSNSVAVSGGGAPQASGTSTNTVNAATQPKFGTNSFAMPIDGVDGQPDTQAGGHPYELTTAIVFNSVIRQDAGGSVDPTAVEDPKDIVVDLPVGFLGSAVAAARCTFSQLSSSAGCPADSQVGTLETLPVHGFDSIDSGLYNMVPEHGVAAEFGYTDATQGSHPMYARVVPSASGYVLQVTSPDIPQIMLTGVIVTFFGDPAAKDPGGNAQSAMFTNPTQCDGQPLRTMMYMDSWQHPGAVNADGTPDLSDPSWVSASSQSPAVQGCNQLLFQPNLSVQPDTTVADSPSGLHVDISVPQSENPNTLATPPLKDATVTLPPGFTVNPSSAAGLEACTPAQIGLGSGSAPTCPDASKIGTVALQTPLLPGTLTGSIYLAQEFKNPFNSLLAGYIVVNDPTTGVVIKIPGNLTPDPLTGQITGVFDNNPQFPFSDLKLDFKGGATGVLATPEKCGTYTTNSLFSPWSAPDSGPAASLSDSFGITSGCVSGFKPSFTAGSQNPQAGAYSPFVLSMSRSDTQENFQGLSVTLPPGMLANLSQVQECSAADLAKISSQPGTGQDQIDNPSCPASSLVGTVTTGAGTGPDPYFLNGKVYLTGPYKGAPYGLAVVVPAVAGPLDLGTVVVRQALDVNPTTAQVTDVSDPFPTILDGIPLRIRRVDVVLNRPKFTINPTSCDVMAVTGTATSTQGSSAPLSNRFQVGGCASLGFSPRLSMKLTGKGRTRSGDHPNLVSVLTQRGGQANIHNVRVALPLSMALDPNNSQHVCSYATAQAVTTGPANCPASTLVGHATAITPLLSKPLSGPVYLVQGIRMQNGVQVHTLPSLLIPLRGQIALDLRAQTSVSHGKLVTTFPTIPDAPVSKFTLTINGGRKGILVITGRGRSICGSPQVTQANLIAQNGKAEYPNIKMGTPCRAVHHKRRGKTRRRHSARHGRRHG